MTPSLSRLRRSAALAGLGVFLASAVLAQGPVRGGALPDPLPILPPDNWWNVDVSTAPTELDGANIISSQIGSSTGLHPDFGGDADSVEIYGMVYMTVPGTQPLEPVTFVEFGNQSDAGAPGRPAGYPIPVEARTQIRWIEGGYAGQDNPGGDRHMLIVDRDHRILFELYHTHWNTALSRWEAGSGAVFPLDSNARRPDTWTSADAAGLAILPGLVRYDEAFGTAPIRHAFRFTVEDTNSYVYPASHEAGSTDGALPMGARLRLKAGKNISGFTPEVQRIFQAMKTYGLIVADNGTGMYIQGAYDTRWDNGILNPAFGMLHASDFELIQYGWQPAVATSAGPLDFYTLAPCRLVDTRGAAGPNGGPSLAPGQRVVRATGTAGNCGIPATAKALAVNVTVINPTTSGNLRFFPGNGQAPNASAISFQNGVTRSNNAVVMLASSGSGALTIQSSASIPVDVTVDVCGYFQ